jgi:hypothetical protein
MDVGWGSVYLRVAHEVEGKLEMLLQEDGLRVALEVLEDRDC